MIRSLSFGLAAATLLGGATPVQARAIRGVAVTPPCAQGANYINSSGYSDGCSSAPTTLSYVDTGWSTTAESFDSTAGARQNHQVWASAHAQPWNIAGVDYPIGYDAAAISAQQGWKDPSTFPAPTGCNYNATGNAGSPKMTCNSVANLDFEGWNMKSASRGCTQLEVNNASGTVTIKNNLWGEPIISNGLSACSNTNQFFLNIRSCSGDTHFIITQNTFDMDGQEYLYGTNGRSNMTSAVGLACPTSTMSAVTYNAFLEGPQKQVQGKVAQGYPMVTMYNFVRNMAEDQTGHGEFFFMSPNTGDTVGPSNVFDFNTVLYGDADGGANDATFWCTYGNSSGVAEHLCRMENNTLVANSNPYVPPNNAATVAKLFMENGATLVDEIDIRDNYYDIGAINSIAGSFRFGALNCGVAGTIAASSIGGNISLQTGLQNDKVFSPVGTSIADCH